MERNKILIADDAELNRGILVYIFEEQYETIEAVDGEDAIAKLKENRDSIAMLFLDLIMPRKSGIDVLEFMSANGYLNEIPVIMITGEATAESEEIAYNYGVMDIVYKPFAPRVVMRRTRNIIDLFENRRQMEDKLEAKTKELMESRKKLEQSNDFLVNALSSVVEFRSLESGEHIQRVKYFTKVLLETLKKFYPEYNFSDESIGLMVNASALHDLGKIAISDNILLKPGKLTMEEFAEMKKHPLYGCELLENFKQEEDEFYKYCYDICRYHHERYDGRGYPDGLKGEDIPIWAQAVALADVYDALVSKRVYKDSYVAQDAYNMILKGECGEFSPKVLECFELAKADFFNATTVSNTFKFLEE